MRERLQQMVDEIAASIEAEAQRRAEELFRERVSSLLSPTIATVRGAGSLPPVGSVPEPAVPAEQGSTSSVEVDQEPTTTKGKPRVRAVMACSKCGAIGKRADSCGKTHNVSASPAASSPAIPRSSSETSSPATPSLKRVDRKPPPPNQPPAQIDEQPSQLQPNVPPPGWTPEEDRREEYRALSELHRKYR